MIQTGDISNEKIYKKRTFRLEDLGSPLAYDGLSGDYRAFNLLGRQSDGDCFIDYRSCVCDLHGQGEIIRIHIWFNKQHSLCGYRFLCDLLWRDNVKSHILCPHAVHWFFVWSRHMNEESHEVEKRHMRTRGRLLTVAAIVAGVLIYGYILKIMGDAMPFIDAFTTVSSVAAMLVSVKMYAEQWWIWVAIDVFTIYMWYVDFIKGSDNIATLLMWTVYLGNAVIMLVKWEQESRRNERKEGHADEI